MLKRCEFVVKIPTKFCINVATAGAILMYDRHMSSNQYAARPWRPGGKAFDYKGPISTAAFSRATPRNKRAWTRVSGTIKSIKPLKWPLRPMPCGWHKNDPNGHHGRQPVGEDLRAAKANRKQLAGVAVNSEA